MVKVKLVIKPCYEIQQVTLQRLVLSPPSAAYTSLVSPSLDKPMKLDEWSGTPECKYTV